MIKIHDKQIGDGCSTFIVGEISGNHNHNIKTAYDIIKAAADAGADAVKLQTYTPDTITLNNNSDYFKTSEGGLWAGRSLYELYLEAYTPWEWHGELKNYAESLGLVFFSTPFDISAVDFLDSLNVPCYKIASYEINDIRLLRYTASKKKPVLISTGAAELSDIEEAVKTCRDAGNNDIILLKCTSAYPAPIEDSNLLLIKDMAARFGVETGLSDHTIGHIAALGAVALGARVVEKHLTISRKNKSVDSAFSMERDEFALMVENIRLIEKVLGRADYKLSAKQAESLKERRSLFVSKDIKKGDIFDETNIKSVRPAYGLNTRHYENIIGRRAVRDIPFATPLSWDMVE